MKPVESSSNSAPADVQGLTTSSATAPTLSPELEPAADAMPIPRAGPQLEERLEPTSPESLARAGGSDPAGGFGRGGSGHGVAAVEGKNFSDGRDNPTDQKRNPQEQ